MVLTNATASCEIAVDFIMTQPGRRRLPCPIRTACGFPTWCALPFKDRPASAWPHWAPWISSDRRISLPPTRIRAK